MGCNGICNRYKAKKPKGSRYKIGQKRCSVCESFLEWNGTSCPCCNAPLRTSSRYIKHKQHYSDLKRI